MKHLIWGVLALLFSALFSVDASAQLFKRGGVAMAGAGSSDARVLVLTPSIPVNALRVAQADTVAVDGSLSAGIGVSAIFGTAQIKGTDYTVSALASLTLGLVLFDVSKEIGAIGQLSFGKFALNVQWRNHAKPKYGLGASIDLFTFTQAGSLLFEL
jgi:hypothetical protein